MSELKSPSSVTPLSSELVAKAILTKRPQYPVSDVLQADKNQLLEMLRETGPEFCHIVITSPCLMDARIRLATYLSNLENQYFGMFTEEIPPERLGKLGAIRGAIRMLKNVVKVGSEKAAGFSALEVLTQVLNGDRRALKRVSKGFLCEFIYLFLGMHGHCLKRLYANEDYHQKSGREASTIRSQQLDEYANRMAKYFKRYRCGLDEGLVAKRARLRQSIMEGMGASEADWNSEVWQKRHVIKDLATISRYVTLEQDEIEGLRSAKRNGIDVHITPYYLSLFNRKGAHDFDRAIRSLVLPSVHYCRSVAKNRRLGSDQDFMGEKSTSPVDCITRRYPHILILKPFDACPQICVYCQRNWEIKDMDRTQITQSKVDAAIDWIRDHSKVTEVLVTGGDPLTLPDHTIEHILKRLSEIPRIERIRIGTRMFVTMPMRLNDGFMKVLDRYHKPGTREITMMTHFEHAAEITPDVLAAVTRVRRLGISIYNQQVFTYYNSRRFETSFLRKKLKLIGVDPYYTFSTKGKEETHDFRVPIARIEQEMKEEARLLSGIVRTDEPVFNVPRLGKSHLRAWQDHEPIMVNAEGQRVFRFYPWESNLVNMKTYIYTDVSIYEYMQRLMEDKEKMDDYASIWSYF